MSLLGSIAQTAQSSSIGRNSSHGQTGLFAAVEKQ